MPAPQMNYAASSRVEICIEGQTSSHESTSPRVHVPGLFHPPGFYCESFKSLGVALRVYPACLAKLRRIRIELRILDAQSPCLLEEAHFQCFALANLLARTCARAINISLKGRDHILKPWTQLDPNMDVKSKTAPEQNALTKWFDANVEATKFAHPAIGLSYHEQELPHFEANLDKIRRHVMAHVGSYSTAAEYRLCEATTILKRMLADEKVRLAKLEIEDS